MVNCGGFCVEVDGKYVKDGNMIMEEIIYVLVKIFFNEVFWFEFFGKLNNFVVLIGFFFDC